MPGERSTLTTPTNARTQRARVLRLLIEARSGWVPLPAVMAFTATGQGRPSVDRESLFLWEWQQ